jgi:hypothetical protein
VQFEVKGQSYVLDFIDEEGRWLLFRPTREGIDIMPVIDDEAAVSGEGVAVTPVTETVN